MVMKNSEGLLCVKIISFLFQHRGYIECVNFHFKEKKEKELMKTLNVTYPFNLC